MNSPKISIVVPVYNVAEYIANSIESVIAQKYDNYELILVDDGSADGSAEICDSFAQQYEYVKVHHQVNQGVSVARNVGIELSRGEWIMFLDGDDLLCDESLCRIDEAGLDTSIDYYLYSAKRERSDGKVEYAYPIPDELNKQTIEPTFSRSVVWGALYNREFIQKHNLRFLEGVINSQDTIFTRFAHHYAKKIHLHQIDLCFIKYREGSASRSWSVERFDLYIENFKKIDSQIKLRGIDYSKSPILNKLIYLKAAYVIRMSIENASEEVGQKFRHELIATLSNSSLYPLKNRKTTYRKRTQMWLFNISLKWFIAYKKERFKRKLRKRNN